jgi:hypothetical protein
MSKEHLMGLSMSVCLIFFATVGLQVPLLEPIVAKQWGTGVPTVVQPWDFESC